MGTRGTFGVRIGGVDKLSYNHFDSYPDGLGFELLEDVTKMLDNWGLEKVKEQARKLLAVDPDSTATPEQIKELEQFSNLGVGSQSETDWYCLIRDLQGKIWDTLTIGYMLGNNGFINDSLFCEWGYILNLDENVLEVYKGFQTEPHNKGRYAVAEVEENNIGSKYYPCALMITFPLDNLPAEKDFFIAVNRAGFDSDEDIVLDYLENHGEISKDDAKTQFGIEDLVAVIENLEGAGHSISVDDNGHYEMEG